MTRDKFGLIYFQHNLSGLIGTLMILIVIVISLFAQWIAPYSPQTMNSKEILSPPSMEHLLGTDDAGKDVLSQLIYGSRVSLIVGFSASVISTIIGIQIGLWSGYFGGIIDNVLMRVVDFLLVIPTLPLMIVIASFGGRSIWNIIIIIGILNWTVAARMVRSQVMSARERDYVLYARVLGANDFYIIKNHIFPQVLTIIIARAVLDISAAILAEATLSFLGLGDPTLISWGMMLHFAFERAISMRAWWFILPPGLAIVWVSLGIALISRKIEEINNHQINYSYL